MSDPTRDASTAVETIRYEAPPIREAVCEFIFAERKTWDLAVPSKIRDALAHRYPAEPTTASPSRYRRAESRLELRSLTSDELVRFSESTLSVHVGRGYGGWKSFRANIVEAMEAYVSVAQPTGINRVRLSYANRTVFVGDTLLEEYFAFGLSMPRLPVSTIFDFSASLDGAVEGIESGVLRATLASDNSEEEAPKVGVRFDLEVYQRLDGPVDVEALMQRVDRCKTALSATFEASIRDPLRVMYHRV